MAKKRKARSGTKAAFVRNHPGLSTPELLALAEKQGLSLTAGYIYNIRAAQKAQADGGSAASPAPEPGRGKASALDAQLRTLIIRIGLDRAEQVFGELKASLSRIV